jgi:hypothetical protein
MSDIFEQEEEISLSFYMDMLHKIANSMDLRCSIDIKLVALESWINWL